MQACDSSTRRTICCQSWLGALRSKGQHPRKAQHRLPPIQRRRRRRRRRL